MKISSINNMIKTLSQRSYHFLDSMYDNINGIQINLPRWISKLSLNYDQETHFLHDEETKVLKCIQVNSFGFNFLSNLFKYIFNSAVTIHGFSEPFH